MCGVQKCWFSKKRDMSKVSFNPKAGRHFEKTLGLALSLRENRLTLFFFPRFFTIRSFAVLGIKGGFKHLTTREPCKVCRVFGSGNIRVSDSETFFVGVWSD